MFPTNVNFHEKIKITPFDLILKVDKYKIKFLIPSAHLSEYSVVTTLVLTLIGMSYQSKENAHL